MRHVARTMTAIRFTLSTRRDLVLEVLALHHQLAVLARATRRFRPSDRLLWLTLRWVWPRWRDALVLVQPATVDRWHRDRFDQRWWRHTDFAVLGYHHPHTLGEVLFGTTARHVIAHAPCRVLLNISPRERNRRS